MVILGRQTSPKNCTNGQMSSENHEKFLCTDVSVHACVHVCVCVRIKAQRAHAGLVSCPYCIGPSPPPLPHQAPCRLFLLPGCAPATLPVSSWRYLPLTLLLTCDIINSRSNVWSQKCGWSVKTRYFISTGAKMYTTLIFWCMKGDFLLHVSPKLCGYLA